MPAPELSFREGTASDLADTFALSRRAMNEVAVRQGIVPLDETPSEADMRSHWLRQRPLIEFMSAQPGGRYWVCENGDGPVGYARVVRFGQMEQLTDVMVSPAHQGEGIGRELLERCWPGDPTPDLARVVIATGGPSDLSLYTAFGVMPVAGHWHLQQRAEAYVERRSKELETTEPAVHVLAVDRAVSEWKRLEPAAIGHERPALHDFFGRDRACLAVLEEDEAVALCWVGDAGEIGPAVGRAPEDLVPVVLAALDRVAKTKEPEFLGVYCTTLSWWLLRRLRSLGFHVYWPSWIMCSVPLPGLDRFMPTRPPHVL